MELAGYHLTSAITGEAVSSRTVMCAAPPCTPERGVAQLVVVNHGVNPMIIFSTNGVARPDANLTGVYNVLGLQRDVAGLITGLCLYDITASPDAGAASQPFLMSRRL